MSSTAVRKWSNWLPFVGIGVVLGVMTIVKVYTAKHSQKVVVVTLALDAATEKEREELLAIATRTPIESLALFANRKLTRVPPCLFNSEFSVLASTLKTLDLSRNEVGLG